MIDVSYNCTDKFILKVNGQKYSTEFPEFSSFKIADTLGNNLALMFTYHLSSIRNEKIQYHMKIPRYESQILKNIIYDLPSCAVSAQKMRTPELMKRFINLKPEYSEPYVENNKLEYPYNANKNVAIVAFSLGKDSLLSLMLARELGYNVKPVYVVEHSMKYEYNNKVKLLNAFEKEFGIKTDIIQNTITKLRDEVYLHCTHDEAELSWATQNTGYSFMLLPYARIYEGSIILFGNEYTTNTIYTNEDKFESSPCIDQTSIWTNQITTMTKELTNDKVVVSSFIEPFMDIVIMAILSHRYPEAVKYIMSCFGGETGPWCQDCEICTKMYLMLVACGKDPKLAGFDKDMLTADKVKYFSIFGGKKSKYQYLNTDAALKEQLFHFALAYKRGNRSYLTLKARRFLQSIDYDFDGMYEYFTEFKKPITIHSPKVIEKLHVIHNEIKDKVFNI